MNLLTILLQVADVTGQTVQHTAGQHVTFFQLLIKGGVLLIPIGILSIISIYLIAEKYFFIHKATTIESKVRADMKLYIKKGDSEKALEVLKQTQGSYKTIFTHGLKNSDLPLKELEQEIEDISNIEVARISKNLNYLGLIAGIAPMLGFIGTISGIIKIFYNISVTDNISIGVIAGGLYEKMISSGSGLIVGVIAYSGYHILNMIVDKFISTVEADTFDILNSLKSQKVARLNDVIAGKS